MAKKLGAKKALLMSALSLLLCCSMLVGTTFAWFTDSVSSTNNIITAGNLDVELYYQVEGQTDWTKVTSTTNIFKENALWEPGHTEVVKLKVVNEGTLALKYQLGVNVASETGSVNVNDIAFKLSDYIKYGIVDGAQTYTRDEAIAAVDATANKLNKAYNSGVTTLIAGAEAVVTMVVYMPTSVDNEANYKKGAAVPTINLGINLFATQVTAESDSFNNQYDKDAGWNGTVPAAKPDSLVVDTTAKLISINDADAFAYLNTLLNDSNFTANYGAKWQYSVELNCDINLLGKEWTPIVMSNFVGFDGKDHTISNLKVTSGADKVGLFGSLGGNDLSSYYVKNLTIDGAYVKGGNYAGALVGSGNCVVENVTVLNATVDAGKYVGGLAGRISKIKGCTVKNSTVVASDKTVGGLVGYCIGDPGIGDAIGNTVENVTVTGAYNVGGLLGQAQNVTVDGNTVKNVTVTSTKALPANASSNEVRTAKLAARSVFAGTTIGANTVENVSEVNAVSNSAELKETLVAAGAAGAGNTTIALSGNIDMTNTNWTPIKVDGYNGADIVTIEGNGATITGLTAPLFAGGFAGGSGIVIKDLTIADSNIVSTNTLGSGAFIESVDSMALITLENCHLVNSTVTGGAGSRTGGLIGWTAGYSNVNDGPVKTYVNITNCSVVDCTITCDGSVGGIYGHAGNNDWTYSTIENCTVKNCTLNSTDDGGWRVGVVVGTANVGEVTINNITESGNTLTQTGKTAPAGQSNLYGRFVPGTTGKLTIDGVAVQ